MENEDMVPANEFCTYHNIEVAFIDSLRDKGLIEIVTIEKITYIPFSQLGRIEKMRRLYYDLSINVEGIDAINHLLERVDRLQSEIASLTNRLKAFEE